MGYTPAVRTNNRWIHPRDNRTPAQRGKLKGAVCCWLKDRGLWEDRAVRAAALDLLQWHGDERPRIWSVTDLAALESLCPATPASS